jgi:SpoVK/Ycf46/Vps4 family AAA+-type ATPase
MLDKRGYISRARRVASERIAGAKKKESEGDLAGAAKLLRDAAQKLRSMAEKETVLQDRLRLFRKAKTAEEKAKKLENGERVFAEGETRTGGSVSAAEEYEASVDELVYRSDVTWDDIGGMQSVKDTLKYTLGLMLAEMPEGLQLGNASRLLLYGPPGTGKTLLAAACSNMLGATFFNVKASNLLSKYFGESTKLISALFSRARSEADTGASLVFIDEFDSLCGERGGEGETGAERRVLSTLLAELDGLAEKGQQTRLITIAATNLPWTIDEAILQRFQKHVLVGLPDVDAREAIFQIHLEGEGLGLGNDITYGELAQKTSGYSGRHIATICQEAIGSMLREMNSAVPGRVDDGTIRDYRIQVRDLQKQDFEKALERVLPSASKLSLDRYETWAEQVGGERA